MKILLFILYPLLGFLNSLRELRGRSAAIVFVSFYALFGYCQDFLLETADIYRIGCWFETFKARDIISSFQSGGSTDVYMWLVMSYVKLFSNNPKVCMAVFGMVFGYLSYLCIRPVYELWTGKKTMSFYLCVLLGLSNISLIHMTGIRFFTAAALFTAIMIQVVMKKRNKWIIATLLTPFIHFGFIPIVLMVFIYQFILRKYFWSRLRLMKVVVVISFIISFIPLRGLTNTFFSEYQLIENSAINGKFKGYSSTDKTSIESEDAHTLYRQANNIFTYTFKFLRNIGLLYFILSIFKRREYRDEIEYNMLMYIAIFSIFSFLANSLISNGGRLFAMPLAFVFIYIAKVFNENRGYFRRMTKRLIFFNFYSIAFLFFNAPRLVTPFFWFLPLPSLIIDGWEFRIP